jgi:hypothetical protein
MKSRERKNQKKTSEPKPEVSPEERDFRKKRNLAIRRDPRRKKNFVTDYYKDIF